MVRPTAIGIHERIRVTFTASDAGQFSVMAKRTRAQPGCVVDRDGYVSATGGQRATAVLDPLHGEGGELGWCPGRYRGTVMRADTTVARFGFEIPRVPGPAVSSGFWLVHCGERAETEGGLQPAGPDDVTVAGVLLRNAKSADPSRKLVVSLRAGTSVELTLSPKSRRNVGLRFGRGEGSRSRLGFSSVKFLACKAREPAFSHAGYVGKRTDFVGGLRVRGPACARIDVVVQRRRGTRHPFTGHGSARIPVSGGRC